METGIDEGAGRFVDFIEVGSPAEPEINRHDHQTGAMRDREQDGYTAGYQIRIRYIMEYIYL